MIKNKLGSDRGLAGWLIIVMILVFTVLVGGLITWTNNDKGSEYATCAERVSGLVREQYGFIPATECETVYDYGEHVLVAVRFRPDTLEGESREGSYLFDISDSSQQIYNMSEEYPYDYDFASDFNRFAVQWGVSRRKA